MSLTEISYWVRKSLPYLLIAGLAFFILFYSVKLIIFIVESKSTHIVLNPAFGSIKKLDVKDATSSAGLQFTLDTVNGEPAVATSAANIFFLPPAKPRFGYREKIYLIAKSLGFDLATVRYTLDGTIATFKDASRTLTIDISYFNFSYDSNFKDQPDLFASAQVPEKESAQEKAIQFLQSIDKYPPELAQGNINDIYLYFNPKDKTIGIVDDRSVAQVSPNLIEVDFYRPDIDTIPVVSSSYFNSQNYVLLQTNGGGYKILRAQVKFFDKSSDQVGAYPLKTGSAAYEDLKAGKGIIISKESSGSKNIIIKKMFLAYYDPSEYEEYLRPVFVFLGENNFVAYVDAVRSDYIGQ